MVTIIYLILQIIIFRTDPLLRPVLRQRGWPSERSGTQHGPIAQSSKMECIRTLAVDVREAVLVG